MRCVDGCQTYSVLLLISGFGTHLLVYGLSLAAGVFYLIFLENLHYSYAPEVALGSGLNTALMYGTGPLASLLLNRYGNLKVGLLGGSLAGVGLILTAACRNVYYMCFMFGILCGLGLGLCYMSCMVAVTEHFDKYRPIAIGFITSATGIGAFVYPPLLHQLAERYGWRGALFIMGAITFNLLPCAAIYKTRNSEDKPPCDQAVGKSTPTHDIENHKGGIDKQSEEKVPCANSQFLLSGYFISFCVSNILVCAGLSVVAVHLAAFAGSMHFEDDKCAWLISTFGAAKFCGHFLFGGLNQIKQLTGLIIWTSSFALAGLATMLLHFASSYVELQVYAAFFGLMAGSFGVSAVDSVVRMVGVARMASAYGYILLCDAIGQTIGAPIAGMVYEATGTYISSMYFGGGIFLVGTAILVPAIHASCWQGHPSKSKLGLDPDLHVDSREPQL